MKSSLLVALLCLFLVDEAISLNKDQWCKCRIRSKKRIIGGREAEQTAYPWMVTLQAKEKNPVPDDLRKLVPEQKKIDRHL